MLRIAPKMMVVLLCGTMLAGCASATNTVAMLTSGDTTAGHSKKDAATAAVDKTAPTDLEGGIRQAQLMRVSGRYDDAIHVLSQLMLMASDDPRVVSEYGKTLAEKGRAQDAVQFLNRAIELSSNDWTLYSALGVSYDQLGNQSAARTAYEHALALHPEEPSVLNNYALSRMLAGDPDGARQLIARAELAGGGGDAKIASNIAMLNKLAPTASVVQNVAAVQKSVPASSVAAAASAQGAPHPVMTQNIPPRPAPVAQTVPRPIVPSMTVRQAAIAPANNSVVMQAVPFDPYAGPVKGAAKPAAHAPRAAIAKTDIQPPKIDIIKTDAKTAIAKSDIQPPKIDIIKPDAKTETKTAANAKPVAPAASAKVADIKAAAPGKPEVKIDIKPGAAKAVPVKAAGKDQIPALRMTANAY